MTGFYHLNPNLVLKSPHTRHTRRVKDLKARGLGAESKLHLEPTTSQAKLTSRLLLIISFKNRTLINELYILRLYLTNAVKLFLLQDLIVGWASEPVHRRPASEGRRVPGQGERYGSARRVFPEDGRFNPVGFQRQMVAYVGLNRRLAQANTRM